MAGTDPAGNVSLHISDDERPCCQDGTKRAGCQRRFYRSPKATEDGDNIERYHKEESVRNVKEVLVQAAMKNLLFIFVFCRSKDVKVDWGLFQGEDFAGQCICKTISLTFDIANVCNELRNKNQM